MRSFLKPVHYGKLWHCIPPVIRKQLTERRNIDASYDDVDYFDSVFSQLTEQEIHDFSGADGVRIFFAKYNKKLNVRLSDVKRIMPFYLR